mgnify:CR=1 FL=1
MLPSAVTSTSSIIIILTLVHPFATSWPSSPKGDARTLRDWLSVSYGMIRILVISSLRSPPKGKTPKWYVKYMTRCFFPHTSRFPLRGNASKRQKGVRDRAPIGCSIAILTANRRPVSFLLLTLGHVLQLPILKKRRLFQGAVLLPLFGYFCRNYFCFFFTGRFLHNLVNTDGEKGYQVEKDEGIGQGIVAFGNEVDNTDFSEGH